MFLTGLKDGFRHGRGKKIGADLVSTSPPIEERSIMTVTNIRVFEYARIHLSNLKNALRETEAAIEKPDYVRFFHPS